MFSTLPAKPNAAISNFGKQLQQSISEETSKMVEEMTVNEELRDVCGKIAREINKNNTKLLHAVRTGATESNPDFDSWILKNKQMISEGSEALGKVEDAWDPRLNFAIERFTEVLMFHHFFQSGQLVAPSQVQPCEDEQYIGASLGFAQELARYTISRGKEGDMPSILIAHSLVSQLMEIMLTFDFKNGNLRRKYDGLKYVLKTMEDVKYEISLVQMRNESESEQSNSLIEGRETKRIKIDSMNVEEEEEGRGGGVEVGEKEEKEGEGNVKEGSRIAREEIEAIRARMEKYDLLREETIKGCRDVQKFSKQAIYSVHRNSFNDAAFKLNSARNHALRLQKIIKENPKLRYGSYSNGLEEWAEGCLTLAWAQRRVILTRQDMMRSGSGIGGGGAGGGGGKVRSPRTVDDTEQGKEKENEPVKEKEEKEGEVLFLSSQEYIGALSDFTGEIGRMAVIQASSRNEDAVSQILDADAVVAEIMMAVNLGGKFTKKADAVNFNLKKVEDVSYELSLMRKGGRALKRETPFPASLSGGEGNASTAEGNEN